MKTKTLLEALLLEHINVEGAEFIQTVNRYDIFKITTYAAAQQFISAQAHTPAGQKWIQNENTFNSNIRGDVNLYFIVTEDTNEVIAGVLSQNGSHTIRALEGSFTSNYALENERGNNDVPFSIHVIEAIPGIHIDYPNDADLEVDDEEENNEAEYNTADEEEDEESISIDRGDPDPCFIAVSEFDGREGQFYLATDDPDVPEFVEISNKLRDKVEHVAKEFYNEIEAQKYIDKADWTWNDYIPKNPKLKIIKKEAAIELASQNIKKDFDKNGNLIDIDTGEILKSEWSTPDLKIKIINGEGVVVGCRNKIYNELNIPETYDNFPVTKIASYALYDIKANRINCPSITHFENNSVIANRSYNTYIYIRRSAKRTSKAFQNCRISYLD